MKESTKIFIDIYHLPQYNLFRNAIRQLGPEKVDLGCVNRGKLVDIIHHECPEFNLFVYGDYKNNKGLFSMATKIIIPRIYQLIKLFRKQNYSIIGAAGYQANVAAKILGIPNFSILDDPRAFILKLLKFSTKEIYLPPFGNNYGKVKHYNALKEWAYLSPKYFNPSSKVLIEYKLESKSYIFIREVATNTTNYITQAKNIIQQLSKAIPNEIPVVLSLEDKSQATKYPKTWIILKEPVSDIHSLMYYSKLVISTGDSMAREGAMLGVQSIYMGNRDMPANRILINLGVLKRKSVEESIITIKDIFNGNNRSFNQNDFREKLKNDWEDVTQLIVNKIKQ
ncbi:MAG: DUF354 domain-containing protein [bacterium]|nr:DUF354 domain-containing protein [bacterium]